MTAKPTIVLPKVASAVDQKVPPSRRGKRAWLVYLDQDTARRLKAAAALNDRSMQKLGEEAADYLLERYGVGTL